MSDRIYTPAKLAFKIVSRAKLSVPPRCIVDFAVGDGQLLRAAQVKWPAAQFIGTDISGGTVSKLRRVNRHWEVSRCDFLSVNSRQRTRVLKNLKGQVSLVLLNPPFSCRGARKFEVHFFGVEISCSLALAFVLTSLTYLSSYGQLLAILPIGCITSEKDAIAWKAIRSMFSIEKLAENDHQAFSGWSPKTVIVRITRRRRRFSKNGGVIRQQKPSGSNVAQIPVVLFRGKIPMYTLNGATESSRIPLIHSTELQKDGLDLDRRTFGLSKTKSICGPAVLIQRVGLPNPAKIQTYLRAAPVALSDCIVAIRCKSISEAKTVKDRLLANWKWVEASYGGTCARYITLNSLRALLPTLGLTESNNSK